MCVMSGANEERPLRADAARNRAKILDAAARVFAERGLDATLDDIAEVADVGVATVYRRFPDKDALVVALFEDAIDDIAALARSAGEFENSWEGFVWFLEEVLQRQCDNRGLRDVFVGSPYAQEKISAAKHRVGPAFSALVARAQRDGYLRGDVGESDILVLEMMISSLGSGTTSDDAALWRRYLAIALDGLVATRSHTRDLPAEAPSDAVLSALHHSRHRSHAKSDVGPER
jgi:AcrR family transcriptional regulator